MPNDLQIETIDTQFILGYGLAAVSGFLVGLLATWIF